MHTGTVSNSLKALALGAATLLVGVAGCSCEEEYYCDSSGCYHCDGVGCRPATPPARRTCRGDFECTSSQVCTAAGCVTRCGSSNANCPQGWACRVTPATPGGYCLAPTEPAPTPNPGTCTSNANCPTGTSCVNGTCTLGCSGASGCACTTNAQCANGTVCIAGACAPATDACRFNSQCGTGRVCINQQCRAACNADAQCAANQRCAEGVCVDRPANECTRDAECGAGRVCVNATCRTRCSSNAECGAGNYCNAGVCLADTRRQPFCSSDAQCAAGSRCLDGVCRRPCNTADECLRTDVQYRNCAPIRYLGTSQSFCQTNNEVMSNCGSASDCAAGQACVDGTCRSN